MAVLRRRPAGQPPTVAGSEDRTVVSFDGRSARRTIVLALVLITIWLAGLWVFSVVAHFLFLLLLAGLLAAAMEPAIAWFTAKGMRRGVATAVTAILLLLGVTALTLLFGRAFIDQMVQLVQSLPGMVSGSIDWLNSTFHMTLNANEITSSLQLTPGRVAEWAENIAGGLFTVLGSATSVLFDTFTVVVFSFYFAASGRKVLEALLVWLPPERQSVAGTIWQVTATKTGGYVVSKIELAALSAVFHGVFFWLIGLPSWLPMALIVGITAQFIPMIGTYIGIVIPVVVALFSDPLDAVWIILFATVYQQIETYVFTPRVSRRTMDVHPAIALAAVFVGAAVWGPLGAIIGIPLAAAVVSILQTYGHRYRIEESGQPDGPRHAAEPRDPLPR